MITVFDEMMGSESPAERDHRKEMLRKMGWAYDSATDDYKSQEFGRTGQLAEEIRKLENFINTDDPTIVHSWRWPDMIREARADLEELREELAKETGVEPEQVHNLIWDYDPQTVDPISEYDRSLERPGVYDAPKYQDAAQQSPSEAAQAEADKEGLSMQRDALREIANVYQQGGLTDADRARMELAREDAGQFERAQRDAAVENLRQRGRGGAGLELQAALSAAEGGADRLHRDNLEMEMQAEQRALEAMRDAMTGGQGLSEDIYRRDYETGTAQDVVNQYNIEGQRDVQSDYRTAQDEETGWRRDQLQRDVSANRIADIYNADALRNEEIWGADLSNKNKYFNAQQRQAADLANAQFAQPMLQGYNTMQRQLGDLDLAEAGAWNAIQSNKKLPSFGAGMENIGNMMETYTSTMNALFDPGEARNFMSGGEGGGGPGVGGGSSAMTALAAL